MSPRATVASGKLSDRVKTDFVTVASHQLRTPISIIRWSLDMLSGGRVGKLSAAQQDYLRQAYTQVDFMARIVNDLLRVSRIDEGHISVRPEPLDLAQLLSGLAHDCKAMSQAYNCRIVLDVPRRMIPLVADKVKMREVMQVLLGNAIRYTRGKGQIRIRVRKGRDGYFSLSVMDNGIGIPAAQQHEIFNKFFRADNALRAQTEGLGLQLYIAKHYVEAMGGTLNFHSTPQVGTTFTVRLPARVKPVVTPPVTVPEVKLTDDELEELYHHISDGMIIVDATRKVLKVNPVAARLFHLQADKVVGKDVSKVILNPKLLRAIRSPHSEKSVDEQVLTATLAGGEVVTYRLVVFPIRNHDVIDGWVILLHDTSRIHDSGSAAERAVRQEREIVSITVHELKSPLGMTKWSLEMLQSERLGKLTGEQRELIDQIYRDNERLLTLVRDLLNLAKLEEGKFSIRRRRIEVRPLLEEAVGRYSVAAKKQGLRLRLRAAADLPQVMGDPGRLGQVLGNLLSNAVKYTPKGGQVTVGVSVMSTRQLRQVARGIPLMRLQHTDHAPGYVVITVHDTGIGIGAEQQRHLFTKFYRAKSVLQTETEGTGLGLYISKSIVTLHRGDIWFTSRPGHGSTFAFSLPVAPR